MGFILIRQNARKTLTGKGNWKIIISRVQERKGSFMYNIRIERTTCPKEKPGADNPLKFGTIFTDHMFICDYIEGQGLSLIHI